MAKDSRERMVESAYELFREHGYTGTGFREINARSGVARGAIYHHFPGGKTELGEAVIAHAGQEVREALELAAADDDPRQLVATFIEGWIKHVEAHGFRAGCSIVAVISESHPDAPSLDRAGAEAFASWADVFETSLRRSGVRRARARRLSSLIVASVEGAVLLARAERSSRPLESVGRELDLLIAGAISSAPPIQRGKQ
jgi:AcrR family transcriptional regulator